MKILLIEDNQNVCDFITLALEIGWPELKIHKSSSGETGIALVKALHPDIVTVDLGLPDISGYEVIKEIRSFSEVPVIVLTARGEEKDIVKALEFGADEYVIKPFGQMELIARIRVLLRRYQSRNPEQLLSFGKLSLDLAKRTVRYNLKEEMLTGTECTVLKQLIEKEGLVTTRESIAEKIWGTDYADSSGAIKVYIRHLREKIEDDPGNPKVILTRFGIGYYLAKETSL
jgi:two-component system KDP operon response regulator KdpE